MLLLCVLTPGRCSPLSKAQDVVLQKFLRAREMNAQKAAEALAETIKVLFSLSLSSLSSCSLLLSSLLLSLSLSLSLLLLLLLSSSSLFSLSLTLSLSLLSFCSLLSALLSLLSIYGWRCSHARLHFLVSSLLSSYVAGVAFMLDFCTVVSFPFVVVLN